MLDRNVLQPSTDHDFRRPHSTLRLKSAALAVCISLAVVLPLRADGGKAVSRRTTRKLARHQHRPQWSMISLVPQVPAQSATVESLPGRGGTDGQLEEYTDSPRNASLDGNGNLAIIAIYEPI